MIIGWTQMTSQTYTMIMGQNWMTSQITQNHWLDPDGISNFLNDHELELNDFITYSIIIGWTQMTPMTSTWQ